MAPPQDPPRAEMGGKYFWSRLAAYTLIAATVFDASYLLIRGGTTTQEIAILEIIAGLAMTATVAWMGSANGREALVLRGKK